MLTTWVLPVNVLSVNHWPKLVASLTMGATPLNQGAPWFDAGFAWYGRPLRMCPAAPASP